MKRDKLCRKGHDDWYPSGECRPCKNAAQRRQSQTYGTHRFKRNHGLDMAGETRRAADQRLAQTPNSYRYNRVHGIGDAGETRRRQGRRWNRGGGFASFVFDIRYERAESKARLAAHRERFAKAKLLLEGTAPQA